MAEFRFVEESHEYFLGDRKLPSVTQVLKEAGLLYYPASSSYHMERGSFVHRATEWIDRGTLDWDSLDDTLRPYCEAYAKFCRDVNPEPILSERPLYHAQFLFAGTLDRVVKMNGFTSLIDIKTGSPHPATALQVSAYAELARVNEDIHFLKCFSLHLRDDGSYRLDEIPDARRNLQIFLAALSVVRWKEENL